MNDLQLQEYRDQIDQVDDQLVELIKKRMELAKSVGRYKLQKGMEIEVKGREKVIKEKLAKLAKQYGFAQDFLENVWELIISEAKRLQKDIKEVK